MEMRLRHHEITKILMLSLLKTARRKLFQFCQTNFHYKKCKFH